MRSATADTWAGVIVACFGAGAVTAAFLVAGRVAGSRRRMAVTLAALGVGILALLVVTPWLPLGAAAARASPGSGTSARTPRRRRGSPLGVEPGSAAGSWRSGRSRSSACVRSRASSTARSRRVRCSSRRRRSRDAGARGCRRRTDYASGVAKLACLLVLAVIAAGCGSSSGKAVRSADARSRSRRVPGNGVGGRRRRRRRRPRSTSSATPGSRRPEAPSIRILGPKPGSKGNRAHPAGRRRSCSAGERPRRLGALGRRRRAAREGRRAPTPSREETIYGAPATRRSRAGRHTAIALRANGDCRCPRSPGPSRCLGPGRVRSVASMNG